MSKETKKLELDSQWPSRRNGMIQPTNPSNRNKTVSRVWRRAPSRATCQNGLRLQKRMRGLQVDQATVQANIHRWFGLVVWGYPKPKGKRAPTQYHQTAGANHQRGELNFWAKKVPEHKLQRLAWAESSFAPLKGAMRHNGTRKMAPRPSRLAVTKPGCSCQHSSSDTCPNKVAIAAE